jgi:sterol desaturase/sphingolipid hydroxylase (fatty acid hydroxylase superfamily)
LVAAALIWNYDQPTLVWVTCLALGFFLWTAVEYAMHRLVLHRLAPHYQHHEEPDTLAYIFAPLWLSGVSAGVLFVLLGLAAGSFQRGALIEAATVSGYLIYEALHVRMHSPAAGGPLLRALRKHHFYHHFGDDTRCYGVTTPIWDYVFRTGYDRPSEANGRADLNLRPAGKGPQRG